MFNLYQNETTMFHSEGVKPGVAKKKKDKHVPHEEKQRIETPEQKQAFETYFMMGEDRSYRKLAKMLNKGVTTIYNWAQWFNWQERIEEREKQVQKIVEERNNKTMAELKLEQARLIDATLSRFWEKVKAGKIEIESWQDYERLWRIRCEIGGETDRKQSGALTELTNMIVKVGEQIMAKQQEKADDEE